MEPTNPESTNPTPNPELIKELLLLQEQMEEFSKILTEISTSFQKLKEETKP